MTGFAGYTPSGFISPKHKYSSFWSSRYAAANSGECSADEIMDKVKAGIAAEKCPLLKAIWDVPLGVNYLRPLEQVTRK